MFILFVVLLLHNLHGLLMRNVAGVAYVAKSWVPNLVAQAGVCCYFLLAQLPDRQNY